jgi:hypothetical protein
MEKDDHMERGPIFIGGIERSGTSLIYALLASHPNIAMTRRTNLWTYFYRQYGDLKERANFERCLAAMLRYKRLLKLQPDAERLRREFAQAEPTYARLFALIEEHHAERLGKPRWGDKSLNTERYAEQIFAAYPNAIILHMVRDPRDRYASAVTRWKVNRGRIGVGTAVWLGSVRLAERNQQRYPKRYKIVRYETLAGQPEETLREICAFIGEEFSPAMLGMDGAELFRDAGGNSSYGGHEVGRISTKSIGRYRKVLSQREIAFMQQYARREMIAYAYQFDPIQFSARDGMLYALVDQPSNLVRIAAWRAMEAIRDRTGRTPSAHTIVGATEPSGA